MKNRPIGVFDSGLGGLTTVKQLHRLLPAEDIVYFGDTGRVPYGSRSREILRKYAAQDMQFLLRHHVKMVISACGTVSSTAADLGAQLSVPFTGIVEPAAEAAVKASRSGKIGVIGTLATISSNSFAMCLKKMRPDATVTQQGCPLFVPLVEGGFTDVNEPVTRMVAQRYLEPVQRAEVDTVILACTHYPIIAPIIGELMGADVTLIDSGAETAHYAAAVLQKMQLCTDRTEAGTSVYYVTDKVQNFEQIGGMFLGEKLAGNVTHVDIDTL